MLQGRIVRWCGALAVSLAVAAPAAAKDDAPKVAPDSPAGTEYQLPVDHARNEGSGGGASSHSSGTPGGAPLFGAGVEEPARRPAAKRRRAAGAAPARTAQRSTDRTARPVTAPATIRARAAAPGGGDGLLAIGAGAAGVLLIGGLAGLALRQRPAIPDGRSRGVTHEH